MSIIERTVIFIDSINNWVGRAISWLLVVMVLNVFLVVVLRYVFGFGAIWMQELYVWSHAIVFLLGAGYTLLHKGHVRIDLIYRSASKKYKSLIDLLGSIFFALPVIYFIFIKINKSYIDVRTFQGYNSHCWTSNISSTNTTNIFNFHLYSFIIIFNSNNIIFTKISSCLNLNKY